MIHKHEGLAKAFKNQELFQLIRQLKQEGALALLAGGCVRDALLDRPFQDIDIVTDASVEQLKVWFPQAILVGAAFGVLKVPIGDQVFDLAQLRKESDYQNGRHPQLVSPGTLAEDAQRRDFTINALFYDPISFELYDFVGGLVDLKARVLRAVGDPLIRFSEDYLRVLRALRFQAQLGFELEENLIAAMNSCHSSLSQLSYERRLMELVKLRQGEYYAQVTVNKNLLINIIASSVAHRPASENSLRLWPLVPLAWPAQILAQMLLEVGYSLTQLSLLDNWPWSRKERQALSQWQEGLRVVYESEQAPLLASLVKCTQADFLTGVKSAGVFWPSLAETAQWQQLMLIVNAWGPSGQPPLPLLNFPDLRALNSQTAALTPSQISHWQNQLYQVQLERQVYDRSQLVSIALQMLKDGAFIKN